MNRYARLHLSKIMAMALLVVPSVGIPQGGRLQFQRVTVEQGLSNPAVTEICQDSAGFIWLGAFSGLNRFDGREVKSIDMPTVHALCTDCEGNVWVGTAIESHGLQCITASRDTIINFDLVGVRSIVLDKDSTLWIGGADGLFHLFPKESRIVRIGREAMADSGILSAASDKRGNLWLVTRSSILRFDKVSHRSRFISPVHWAGHSTVAVAPDGTVWIAGGPSGELCKINPTTLQLVDVLEKSSGISAGAVAIDSSGRVYVGTWSGGLKVYDPGTGNWATYRHSESDPHSISDDMVNAVFFDRTGNLWVATAGGVSWASYWRKGFSQVSAYTADDRIHPAEVQNIVEDGEGNLWLGTMFGLKRWDREKGTIFSVKSVTEQVNCLAVVDRNKLLIGVAQSGTLLQLDTRVADVRKAEVKVLPGIREHITAMYCDGDTVMWLGCVHCRIYRYDLRTGRTLRYRYETTDQLIPGRVSFPGDDCPRMIRRDRLGILWIATRFGILALNEHAGVLRRYVHRDEGKLSFWQNTWCIYEDTRGRFWVGSDLGLDLLDRSDGSFRPVIHASRRLAGKTVVGIVEDRTGALWLQTDGRLLKYNHDTGELKEYGHEAGFPMTHLGLFFQYGTHACRLTSFGEIVLGIRDGFVLFRPDELWDNPGRPTVAITGVNIFGQPQVSTEQPVKIFALAKQPLQVNADYNEIEFKFAGLDYTMPAQIKYAVRLEPVDRNWSYLGTQNSIRFINLSPGTYRLRVLAANGDSAWSSTEATYSIEILPPWWRTRWAYFLYAVLVIGTVYLIWRAQIKSIRTRHEFQMAKFEAEKLHEIDEMKSRFFTNISHEFRTPLTLILNPVKEIADRAADEKTKDELRIVHRNARRLLQLVNQLLDISRLEAGTMKLHAVRQNIIPLLRAFVSAFSSYAERKRITLRFNTTADEIIVLVDKEIIEKTITNILSNALKFTPEGGLVEVSVTKNEERVDVQICDTGIGIPKDELPKIFDRFYQVDGSHTRAEEGTGIGLALAKELIELHKCKIVVESEVGKGTTVTVSIPLGTKHLSPEEISESMQTKEEAHYAEVIPVSVTEEGNGRAGVDSIRVGKKPTVLIVEDNDDMRKYIGSNLESEYAILEAKDGEDGWNKSTEFTPDMIVTDVMMPKMDGFELCKRIKMDERTSHIPVILLTAKAAGSDKMEGLETGADDYIMKPFEQEELKARIRNLIEQRNRIHEHFRKKGILELNELDVTPVDRKFLEKVFHIIEENIPNTSFGVESLAEMAAVSRAFLHKKVVSLTGEPPVELIRRMRLTKAAQLLEKKGGNVSEIAFEVGFSNPAYFSECFKKQFGMSPSQYPHKPADI